MHTSMHAYFNPTLTLSLTVCVMSVDSDIHYLVSHFRVHIHLHKQMHWRTGVDLPCSSRSWPPSGSKGGAGMPVWTLAGWGWHSAADGPWWSGSQNSACTGAASAALRGHRTHCTLTMHWPPSWQMRLEERMRENHTYLREFIFYI